MVGGLQAPTTVAWTPDGRMLIAQKGGQLKVAAPGAGTATQILDISSRVNHAADRGLLGLAVDANYGGGAGQNRYIYLLFTYDVNPLVADDGNTRTVSRLERFTLSASNQVAFDKVLLGSYVSGACPQARNDLDCIPSDDLSHSIGTVRADPDGTLWVGSGDAASFGGVDTLALRTYDEQSMAGKIMHVDRDGKGLPQHSFCPSETNLTLVCTKLFAKGFRNPYRFTLRPGGAGLMVGDVGWNQREEVDLVRQGGKSYGWPCYEGSQRTTGYRDLAQCQPEYAKEGTSQAHTPPQYEYLHQEGRTVIGGPTYPGGSYPSAYDGTIFYGDYGNQLIRRLSVNGQDEVVDHHDFATNWQGLVGLELAPSGNVALVDIGTFNNDGAIRELVYQSQTPTARASASPTSGAVPLQVNFDGTLSSDPDGDSLTYRWDFGDGATSSAAKPTHVYTQAGPVTARLTVDDGHGNSDTTSVDLRPGNDAPTATIDSPAAESTYRDGQTITLRGSGSDPQDGQLAGSALSWRVLLHHGTHVHDAHAEAGVATTSFTAGRDHDADSYYEVRLTARDSAGLEGTRTIFLRPETVQLNVASTPTGAPLSYGGRDFTAPLSTATAIGFQTSLSAAATFLYGGRTFYFDRWSDGGARERSSYTVPSTDVSLRAFYVEDKAEGRAATASTVQDNEPSFSAGAAVDGDPGTRWSSDRLDNQYWQVDLGSVRSVDSVRLDWEAAFASRYRIETSTDGTTFSTAADEAITQAAVRTTQFTARQARYVRIRALERGTHYGISFWDARVFGPDDDTTAPETVINSGPSGNLASQTATFTFSGGSGASFECRMDAGAWVACATPKTYTALDQGQHTFEVRATAPNGQTDPTPASRTFTVDTTGPETAIGVGPAQGSTITSSSTSFSFTSPDLGATFECSLDGAAWAPCTSPQSLTSLGDGQHTFQVRAKDAAANTDPSPASRTFTVDTTAPQTTITAGPAAGSTITTSSTSFEFSGEAGGSFECNLDDGGWATCSSPKAYSGLAQGPHSFQVRATDAAGNTDATPASRAFTVDVTPPGQQEDKALGRAATASTVQDNEPSFSAGAAVDGDPGTRWSSDRLDNQYWQVDLGSVRSVDSVRLDWEAAFASRYRIETSTDGTTFSTAADEAITQAAVRTTQFTARQARYVRIRALERGTHYGISFWDARVFGPDDDTTAPETAIGVGPAQGSTITSSSTSFSFTSPDLGATFECSLDAAAWAPCSSPKAYSGLAQGSHSFQVRAKDAAGNTDPSPASRTFTVDTAGPDTTINSGPSSAIATNSAQFTFSGSATATRYECKLDGGNYSACSSPHQLTSLADGSHTFTVRAFDAAGNPDPTPASASFTVDTTPPDTTISSGPSGDITATSATFGFSSEPGASFECKLDSGAWATCASPKTYSGLSVGDHSVQVRARDAFGRYDPTPATRSFRVVDNTPPDTTITSGPTGTVTGSSQQFAFASEAGATFQCRVDSGAWFTCVSPRTVTGLQPGAHTFRVRAKDTAGNIDPTPARRNFTVAAGTAKLAPSAADTYGTTIRSTPGLTALYGLGDQSSTSARATAARPGAYHGDPKRVSPLVKRASDQHARWLDGRDDWIALDPKALGHRAAFSVELWLKLASRRQARVLALSGPGGSDLGLETGPGSRPRVMARAGKGIVRATGPRLRVGRRYHVVAASDGRRLRLYVNGKLVRSVRYRARIRRQHARRLTLGPRGSGSHRFRGTLDELALYKRALSSRQIRTHYRAGR